MVRRTDELFGLKFGKNKKVDTALSWDKASKIIEKDLKDFVNNHQEVDWYNRGKPEIRNENEYMTISSMTGATLQFIYDDKDGTGVAIVDGPDIKPQKFNCTVAGNRISNNIGDAYNCFIRVDKEQGKINAKKNQKHKRESLINRRMIQLNLGRKVESVGHKSIKNESRGREAALRVSEFGGTLLSYMMELDTYAKGELSDKLNKAYTALIDLVDAIDEVTKIK